MDIKLICLIADPEKIGTLDEFYIGNIYYGHYNADHPRHFWSIKKGEGWYNLQSLDNFEELSKYREKRINEILEN